MRKIDKQCFECDATENLMTHHVVPRSLGGTRKINICESCHGKIHSRSFISHGALTKLALDERREQGKPISRTPYGFDLTPDRKHLVENKAEQRTIKLMIKLRKQGLSYTKIAQELDKREIPTKRGCPKWDQSSINSLIKRWSDEPIPTKYSRRSKRNL